jgi:vitamin B12 transporter
MNKILSLCIIAVILIIPLAIHAQDIDVHEDEMLLAMYFDMDQHLDQKIEIATRVPKSLRQIAENVTVVTAEEIQRMNAHSVEEILNRVPGVFIQFNGKGFNQTSGLHFQDSDFEHVLVLLDGIRWNDITYGMAATNSIPVAIIERIEVIKGPASSTWGSALGGVVNIVTKRTGTNNRPSGVIFGSYGEQNSQEYHATMAGKVGPTEYFVATGSQSSDGFLHNRYYDRDHIYGKVSLNLPHKTILTLTSGYSEPEMRFFDAPSWGMGTEGLDRNFWNTLSINSSLSDNLRLNATAFHYKQKYAREYYGLPDEISFFDDTQDNTNSGFTTQLTGYIEHHQVILGGEFERSHNDDTSDDRDYDETWAIYFNDTFTFGDVTFTPGIRYDHLSLTENIISPSLGIIWQTSKHTLLRFLVSQGFRKPYMGTMDDAEPDIESEKVTSYQAGIETSVVDFLRLKVTLFNHRITDEWIWNGVAHHSGGDAERYGYELDLKTTSWRYFSAKTSFTYVYTDYYGEQENDDSYSGKLTLLYDNPNQLTAELFGRYMWWNEDRTVAGDPDEYGTMIWDLSVTKSFRLCEHTSVDLFATAHNLFDGRDYWIDVYDNAHRWVEAGLRLHF